MDKIINNWTRIKDNDGNILFRELSSVDLCTNRQCKTRLSSLEIEKSIIDTPKLTERKKEQLLLRERAEIYKNYRKK